MMKAVIYDVDGTMVDSEPAHVASWEKALQLYTHSLEDLSEAFRSTMAGKKPVAIAQGMVEELQLPINAEVLLKNKTDIFMHTIKTALKEMPGVSESVKRFHHNGYKLGIGTSLTKDYIDIVLDTLNLKNYFDVIVTGDEIKNGKPHPDTYLIVAEKLGLKPEECVVIEDAKTGIQSAKAAGCYCIAIENPNALKQDTSQADRKITTLDEITNTYIKDLTPSLEDGFTF